MTTATQKPAAGSGCTIAEARLHAIKQMPYLAHHIMSLIPVQVPGLNTWGVDERMRMYYDPETLHHWSLPECSATVLHEDMHVWLRHFERAKAFLPSQPQAWELKLWNIAGDCSINSLMRKAGVKMPGQWIFPDQFGLPDDLTTEEYYEKIEQKIPRQQFEQGDGPQGPGREGDQPGNGGGGSCADGQPRAWEHGSEKESGTPEIGKTERELIDRRTAEEIKEHESRNRGKVPAGLVRAAELILKPKTDPWRELLSAVRYAVTATNGFGDFTYRKLPRRSVAGGVRLPAHVRPRPSVLVIVDTSGSMGEKDLGLALGMIDQATRHLPAECLRVASADAELYAVKKVWNAARVELLGGGGTDMSLAIVKAADTRPSPDVIVVATDGETPWPHDPVRQRVVACITRKGSSPAPEWIKSIYVHEE